MAGLSLRKTIAKAFGLDDATHTCGFLWASHTPSEALTRNRASLETMATSAPTAEPLLICGSWFGEPVSHRNRCPGSEERASISTEMSADGVS